METTGYITIGLLVFGMLVEIVPVKWSPLGYIGKKINKNLSDKIDSVSSKVSTLEEKVDMNDIDTIRNRIIANEALLRKGEIFTEKQWENLYQDVSKWNMYHDTHRELNGFLKVVIENINEHYHNQTLNK